MKVQIKLDLRESDVLPGKAEVKKKSHNSVKLLQVISKFERDLYISMLYLNVNLLE